MRSTMLTIAFALLTGCVSSGMRYAEHKALLPAVKPDEGRVYFYRNASLFGAAIQPNIWLNGAMVGASKPGGFFCVDRPAGPFSAGVSTEVTHTLSFTLEGGETKYVRTTPGMGLFVGRINFELVNAPEAAVELQSLRFTGPAPTPPAPAPAAPSQPVAEAPRAAPGV
jgi:hypothetical protein